MKKTLAALTAVALAAGLSLAAVVAPASADDSTTPSPTPAASSAPTATPTPAPETSTPATTTPVATVAAATSTPYDGGYNNPSAPTYETVLWSMAPGNGQAVTKTDGAATYPQIHVTRVVNEHNLSTALNALDTYIPQTCGMSYQIDVYIQTDGNVDNTAALDALYSSGLAGPNGAQDGPYLAPGGSGTAWKYVTVPACNTVAPVTPTVSPTTTCGQYGSITIPTTTPHVDYTFNGTVEPAGTVITNLSGSQSVVSTPKPGYKFSGSQSVTYTLDAGTYVADCDLTITDPTVAQPTCTGPDSPNNGSITIKTNVYVTYALIGPGHPAPGTTFATNATDGTSETIGGLAAGAYTVTATALSGHTISGSPTFSFPVNETTLTAPNCVEVAPAISTVLPSCAPDPTQIKAAGFTATAAENEGQIVLPADANVTYKIDPPSNNVGDGSYTVADGTHTVTATLIPSKVSAGITFSANPGVYTLNADKTVATWTITFTSDCGPLPTLASWHTGAVGTPAGCTLTGGQAGTITVLHGTDFAHPTGEDGKVTYTLVNNGNGHTTNLGSTATTVSVAPGSYTVKATPTNPADGLIDNPNPIAEIDYSVTIAAARAACGDPTSLAFTGGTIAWFGFVLAGGMLFLGIAFLLIRRRGNRTAE